ncbi:hypothetical protein [Millisia brevis]|uniref:hypothetical protein n=1 Tax=Millisia brevis TaxID=264148 RepID=UPI00082DF1F3|nr:hypothetical protein [Millisia brevis]
MTSLAKSAAAAASLGAALLLTTPATAGAVVQNGTATLTADGNNIRADFTGVNTSSGAVPQCWIQQMTPFFAESDKVFVNPLGAVTINWGRTNGTFSMQAVCTDPGGPGGNIRVVAPPRDITLPTGAAPGGTTPAPAEPGATKPFWCALGIPTGSAGC